MINEPTAAALSYGILGKKNDSEKNIIVYDFGGGTLDVSLLNIDDGVFEVIATTGDSYLGGEDFTQSLYHYFVNDFKKKINLNKDDKIKIHQNKLRKLRQICETTKIKLSKIENVDIFIENFWGTNNLKINVTRQKFQEICSDLLDRAIQPVIEIMKSGDINIDDIDDVLLVGGTTQIPVIQFMLHNYFNIKPTISSNPDYIVSAGAAIHGYMLNNNDDPFCKDIVLVDVIPLTLGIETSNGIFSPIIERNSTIPIKITKKYTTDTDNENQINIKIYEGERMLVKDNFMIGDFVLKGIEEAPKGIPIIEITFLIDVNGIINVSAKDIRSESENQITINNSSERLTTNEINKLILEAEEYQKEDFIKQTNIERKNDLTEISQMIFYNLDNKETKMDSKDKEFIYHDISEIISLMNSYDNQQLLKIIDRLKRKYSSLILKLDNENEGDIKSLDKTEILFSDLNLDESPLKIPASCINDEDNEKSIVKDNLMKLCNQILNELNTDNDFNSATEFVNYIHSIIVWSNVEPDLTDADFSMKMDEIKINYNKYKSIEKVIDYKEELIKLCEMLLNDINQNTLPMSPIYCNALKNYVNNIVHWVNKKNYANNDVEYKNKIEKLNIKCEELYELSQN